MTTDDFDRKAKVLIDDIETVVRDRISKSPRIRRLKERIVSAVAKALKSADDLVRKIDDMNKGDDAP